MQSYDECYDVDRPVEEDDEFSVEEESPVKEYHEEHVDEEKETCLEQDGANLVEEDGPVKEYVDHPVEEDDEIHVEEESLVKMHKTPLWSQQICPLCEGEVGLKCGCIAQTWHFCVKCGQTRTARKQRVGSVSEHAEEHDNYDEFDCEDDEYGHPDYDEVDDCDSGDGGSFGALTHTPLDTMWIQRDRERRNEEEATEDATRIKSSWMCVYCNVPMLFGTSPNGQFESMGACGNCGDGNASYKCQRCRSVVCGRCIATEAVLEDHNEQEDEDYDYQDDEDHQVDEDNIEQEDEDYDYQEDEDY